MPAWESSVHGVVVQATMSIGRSVLNSPAMDWPGRSGKRTQIEGSSVSR